MIDSNWLINHHHRLIGSQTQSWNLDTSLDISTTPGVDNTCECHHLLVIIYSFASATTPMVQPLWIIVLHGVLPICTHCFFPCCSIHHCLKPPDLLLEELGTFLEGFNKIFVVACGGGSLKSAVEAGDAKRHHVTNVVTMGHSDMFMFWPLLGWWVILLMMMVLGWFGGITINGQRHLPLPTLVLSSMC